MKEVTSMADMYEEDAQVPEEPEKTEESQKSDGAEEGPESDVKEPRDTDESDESLKMEESEETEESQKTDEPEKTDDRTMVPHQALHEEREKRKEAQQQSELLRKQVELLQAQLNKLTAAEPAGDDDYTKTDREKELERQLAVMQQQTRQQLEQTRISAFQQQLNTVDQDLVAEGYHGFKIFTNFVSQELQRMANQDAAILTYDAKAGRFVPDPVKAAEKYDKPEVWKSVYKQVVFPQVSAAIQKNEADAKRHGKQELKKQANSDINKPGQSMQKTPPQADAWGVDEYLALQKNARVTV